MTVGARLTAAFGSVLLVIVAGAAITTWQFSGVARDTRRIIAVDDRLTSVHELERGIGTLSRRISTLAEQQNAATLLKATQRARSVLARNLADADAAFADTGVAPPPTLAASTGSAYDELNAIDRLTEVGDWQAIRMRVNIQLDQILRNIDEALSSVGDAAHDDREQALQQINQRRRRAQILLAVTALLSVLVSFILGVYVTRSITGPLAQLKRAAHQLAERDFNLRVPTGGRDELSDVGQDLLIAAGNLESSYSALKRSNDDLEQFAHVVSHDLREPLRTVTIFSQLLKRESSASLGSDVSERLALIINAAHRMNELIDGILDYSRLTHSAGTSLPEELDVSQVIDSVLKNLHVMINESGAAITCDPLPRIKANRVQMLQVFQNLISNAIKYRKPDIPPAIHVSAQQHADRSVFCVADNGLGIPLEHQSRIFGAFQQIERPQAGGVGLGLATTKRMVEQHGGDLWVQSDGESGSRFFFSVPRRS